MTDARIHFAIIPKQMSDKSWIYFKRYISYYTDQPDGKYPEKALNYLGIMVPFNNKPMEVYRISYDKGKQFLDLMKQIEKLRLP